MRVWVQIQALKKALVAEVERRKWELVSLKMLELGEWEIKKSSAAACEKKAKSLR